MSKLYPKTFIAIEHATAHARALVEAATFFSEAVSDDDREAMRHTATTLLHGASDRLGEIEDAIDAAAHNPEMRIVK